MEEMKLQEDAGYDRPVYRTDKEKMGGADKGKTLSVIIVIDKIFVMICGALKCSAYCFGKI